MTIHHISFNFGNADDASACDQLPVWSAPFGLRLLETVRLKPGLRVLDIGTGTGFPLLELAQRLGKTASLVGIDPWSQAAARTRFKARMAGLDNVEIREIGAEALPFGDSHFDLVISNNGINNVADQEQVLKECFRTLKPGGQLVVTMNLPETMKEFYGEFRDLLRLKGRSDLLPHVDAHISEKRKTLAENWELITGAGFQIRHVLTDSFLWPFVDGTAFLNHAFINAFFLPAWAKLFPENKDEFLEHLERRLNEKAAHQGGFTVSIPFVCFDGLKL